MLETMLLLRLLLALLRSRALPTTPAPFSNDLLVNDECRNLFLISFLLDRILREVLTVFYSLFIHDGVEGLEEGSIAPNA